MWPIPDSAFCNKDRILEQTRMHKKTFLFSLGVDWVMRETTLGTKADIKWTFTETLDNLDFTDDIVLLSHCYGDIQSKSKNLAINAGKIGLKINTKKTKPLRNNSETADPITFGGNIIEEVTEYLLILGPR